MSPIIAAEIQAEQDHGRQKYGGSPDNLTHDDQHTICDWGRFIQEHAARAIWAPGAMEERQELIKVAGLAVSAIEAIDRRIAAPTLTVLKEDPMIAWNEVEEYRRTHGGKLPGS